MTVFGGTALVNPPLQLQGTFPVAPSVTAGGRAPINPPPLTLEGRVAVAPPIATGGLQPLAPPGNRAPVNPPLSLGGRVAVRGDPERHFDRLLAFLVWVGTWGQQYFQNQTGEKTGEPHDLWLQRIHINRAVAWRELQIAWDARGAPDHPINPDEMAHVQAFVAITREMCDASRLTGIHPLNRAGKDVDMPLWDRMLKKYIDSHYGPQTLTEPLLENQAPPLIV